MLTSSLWRFSIGVLMKTVEGVWQNFIHCFADFNFNSFGVSLTVLLTFFLYIIRGQTDCRERSRSHDCVYQHTHSYSQHNDIFNLYPGSMTFFLEIGRSVKIAKIAPTENFPLLTITVSV